MLSASIVEVSVRRDTTVCIPTIGAAIVLNKDTSI